MDQCFHGWEGTQQLHFKGDLEEGQSFLLCFTNTFKMAVSGLLIAIPKKNNFGIRPGLAQEVDGGCR